MMSIPPGIRPAPDPRRAWRRMPDRSTLIAVAGLLLLTALVFHRALARGTFVYSDFSQMFEPLRALLREGLAAGEGTPGGSPLWTGRLNNGSPVLANPLHA